MAENIDISNYILTVIPYTSIIIPVKLPLNRWQKIHNSIFPPTSCTEIVVFGAPNTIGNNLGLAQFTKFLRSSLYIPSFTLGVIIGLILSDAGLSKSTNKGEARLALKQSMIHFPFFWSTFLLLSHYCASVPYIDNTIVKGILYYSLRFDTRALPCFTILYDLFYINKIKVIPIEIYDLLCPVALAYWIMGDGTGNAFKGLYLCTDSFSTIDIVRLMNVLIIRYDITSKIHNVGGKQRIYIPSKESKKLLTLVGPHMHPSMMYKLTGGKKKEV